MIRKVAMAMMVLSCVFLFGCKKKKKTYIPPPTPSLAIWDAFGYPVAIYEIDNSGDDPFSFGLEADLLSLEGTYDTHYIYVAVDLYSATGPDVTGDCYYVFHLDLNASMSPDAGDLFVFWDGTLDWSVEDFNGNEVAPGLWATTSGPHDLDFALPKSLFPPLSFRIDAQVWVWDVDDYYAGDIVPDSGFGFFDLSP